MVNELLIQMQSFDAPPFASKVKGVFKDFLNRYLAPERQLKKDSPEYTNILLIAATNRAAALDPALMRPGRFDRVLHFDLPSRTARLALIDYFLGRKSHDAELNVQSARDDLAAATLGYTPASLERLFDEALLLALRDERSALTKADLWQARMEIEIGLPEPMDLPEHERRTIATHEAGHATAAYLVGKGRKLEVLSIIKRKEALGFLAHRLREERHTQQRGEMLALIQIALAGMAAEELFFDESGSGPAGDLAAATNIAVEMVGTVTPDGLEAEYSMGTAGGLPGGNAITYLMSGSPIGEEPGDEAADTPADLEGDVAAFYATFNAAQAAGDGDALAALLHPAVFDLYGADQCDEYLEDAVNPDVSITVVEVTAFGEWTWERDEVTTIVPQTVTLVVGVLVAGEAVGEQEAHLAYHDGEIAWFTDCGDPLGG